MARWLVPVIAVAGCNGVAGLDDLRFEANAAGGGTAGQGAGAGAGEGGTGAGGVGGGQGQFDFFDDFERPNDFAVGNDWVEKEPDAFAIANSVLFKNASALSYRDNLVYRPAGEDVRDVEITVLVSLAVSPPIGNPQMFARVRSASVALSDSYDGYLFWVGDDPGMAYLSRQLGTAFAAELAAIPIQPPLDTTGRYRMRLRVTGTDPVSLEADIHRVEGGMLMLVAETVATDSTVERILEPGTVGVSAAEQSGFAFDEFTRLDL